MKSKLISMDAVAAAVLAAGFKGWRVAVIIAIVWAESGGDVYAIGIVDHDPTSPSNGMVLALVGMGITVVLALMTVIGFVAANTP